MGHNHYCTLITNGPQYFYRTQYELVSIEKKEAPKLKHRLWEVHLKRLKKYFLDKFMRDFQPSGYLVGYQTLGFLVQESIFGVFITSKLQITKVLCSLSLFIQVCRSNVVHLTLNHHKNWYNQTEKSQKKAVYWIRILKCGSGSRQF